MHKQIEKSEHVYTRKWSTNKTHFNKTKFEGSQETGLALT